MDVVARLKSIADIELGAPIPDWVDTPNGWGGALAEMCRDAIAEIEYLRALAGAVSQGQTFAQIRETTGGVVLKAFDGA